MGIHKPFLLKPVGKDYIWGGNRLNDDFGKSISMQPLAETWECSTHPDGQSVRADTGESLGKILKMHSEYLGSHASAVADGELPILIKLIDAKDRLSVQVHPDDAAALRMENSLGKTEMWYVLDAKPGAELIYGFDRDVSEAQIRTALGRGTITQYLNHVHVHKNDVFYIPAGTVHAIGAGVLIAEIQENSNITYRLFDYERTDKTGKTRELHIEKALKVANLKSSAAPRQPMRVLRYRNGCASELLARCRYFQVERLILNTEIHRDLADFRTGSNSFHTLLCIDGCGVLFGENISIPFFKGDCIFVPADSVTLKLHGKAQLLNVSC